MMNKSEILTTEDGSFTIKNNLFDETYHSVNGAYAESMHVFINSGFLHLQATTINVFEVGFGTGLNALLTFIEAQKLKKKVNYVCIEKFPIDIKQAKSLNYDKLSEDKSAFLKLHTLEWNKKHYLSDYFEFSKICQDFTLYSFIQQFDLVYFDAFSYETQPEMWSLEIFEKIYKSINKNGIIVTYSSKGIVKQNLRAAGFFVKRLKGFKKRHILRAEKF
ncbi:MAG: tRNA (5-methylaminomethyl-2-thiouridine)(34)-methyltransferase MnmD [Bacteroidales bacterium]|nr:tRNA (5-methylaminomethyl-2-thiouridine)(34)-methyltransferase MnmD [Bacteroidales bacterium]